MEDMEGEDGSNAFMLPSLKKKRGKKSSHKEREQQVKLSKNMQRKLRRLQEEEDKKKLRVQVMETLEKHKLSDDAFALLHSSGTLGQEETMKEKLQRAMNYKRAGLPVPSSTPLFRQRPVCEDLKVDLVEELEQVKRVGSSEGKRPSLEGNDVNVIGSIHEVKDIGLSQIRYLSENVSQNFSIMEHSLHKKSKRKKVRVVDLDPLSLPGQDVQSLEHGEPEKKRRKNPTSDNTPAGHDMELSILPEVGCAAPCMNNTDSHGIFKQKKKKKKRKKKLVAEDTEESEDVLRTRLHDSFLRETLNTQAEKGNLKLRKVVVPINRPDDVVKGRVDLPIVMMEQEIVEAISENDVVIVCGETGCGKTTQVPQFLYEAGFGSSLCPEKSGVIGVTQPRRVAVLATAKRVAYEMNVPLGQDVGFQVRHDRKIGDKSCVKFMTDGILLREVQADFLLNKYSVIVLDEAHERSLNTDILIGMLSRILPLRKSIHEDYCRKKKQLIIPSDASSSPEPPVMPLKLVIMSATLRVEDFTSNRRMFAIPPPVIQVPARQYPVTVHFSAKTELLDYVGRAQKKVCAIHRKLPPGGILVFLTGQREVEYLCRKLRRAFKLHNSQEPPKDAEAKDRIQEADVQELGLESISNAMDGHLDKTAGGGSGGLGFAEPDENFGEKDEDEQLSDSDDEGFSGDGDDDSLSDSDEEKVLNLHSSLDVVEDTNTSSKRVKQTSKGRLEIDYVSTTSNSLKDKLDQSTDPGPLYVLPLYAMLPAAAQLRVFAQVPEVARLVVVATNVAETSITIPGIRYVVDTGRSKERDFDQANGVSKYEVRWISKASANQRAGRAGRTGPGHCYRLYSSAVFSNIFPKFAPPEISTAPIEGVVLVMKRMGINKVVNFPFPTPPERQALVEAERCLRALSALNADTGLLTPIGKAMSVYPISPRHARMLLTALHASQGMDGQGHIVLAFAVAAAAALSLENPFLRESGIEVEDPSLVAAQPLEKKSKVAVESTSSNRCSERKRDSKKEDQLGVTEAEKARRKQSRAEARRAHAKFRNNHSDALGVVNALYAYENSENRERFCETNYLHGKTMQEMAKLRYQLSQLVVQYSLDAGAQLNEQLDLKTRPALTRDYLLESERCWHCKVQPKLNINQEIVLQQAICAGWADRVARRLSARDRALIAEEDGNRKAIRYQACAVEETVLLHPASSLAREAPEFVVYSEIVTTGQPYMWGVTGIQASWLVSQATPLCTFSKPVADPPPWYDPIADKVMCWVLPSFGPHLWELPLHPLPMKNSKVRLAVFAAALLQGKVVPSFSSLLAYLAADPSVIMKPESHGQQRVGELLHKLGAGLQAIDTRDKLAKVWQTDPTFLYPELLAWLQRNAHSVLKQVWSRGQQEAGLNGAALYSKPNKKKQS